MRQKQARAAAPQGDHAKVDSRRASPADAAPGDAQRRSTISSSTWKRRSSATRSSPASRASTAATRAPCARSRSAPACCRARTARRCSRAARRRRWSSPRSAPARDEQIIDALHGRVHASASCSTTTCRRTPPARPAAWARPSAARSATAAWPSARCSPCCRPREEFAYSMRVVSEITESNGSLVDGLGLRRQPRADGRRRADQGARRRHRDGPDQGRQPLRRADRHPRRRGSPRRHGLQGGRHRPRHHRAADGHQDPGHHQGDHGRSRCRRRARAACTSWA